MNDINLQKEIELLKLKEDIIDLEIQLSYQRGYKEGFAFAEKIYSDRKKETLDKFQRMAEKETH